VTDAAARLARALPGVLFTIWIYSAGTSPSAPPGPEVSDKLLHAVAFALCAILYVPLFELSRAASRRTARFVWAALLATGVGGSLEIWQAALPHRTAEWGDFWADLVGAAAGGWVAWRCSSWLVRRQSERGLELGDGS
jgi:VanZ family protein